MKKIILTLLAAVSSLTALAQRPDTIWYRYDDRFTPNKVTVVTGFDSITFTTTQLVCTKANGETGKRSVNYPPQAGHFQFTNPGRILYKPYSMPGDYTDTNNQWCFSRSKESDHFVIFWEKGTSLDADALLKEGEKCWPVYTKQLGFVKEGNSSTDTYKVIMRVYNTTEWIASGSGEDMKVGTLNLCPWAATSRGGATLAHEIGHTFQYLTNVDCGANSTHGFNYGLGDNGAGGNGFWEDCANWMAYKVYPERQFTDGEYFEQYLDKCHLNIMHESARYTNCFYQDYLCEKFGQDFIGRLWRESTRPEDPVDAIKRLQGLNHTQFSALMYDCFAHMCTWDVDAIRARAAHRHGAHGMHLEMVDVEGDTWYQVKADRCPENYGYNITRLNVPAAGNTISIRFQGIAGAAGYRSVNKARAGWRWGIVSKTSDGATQYGEMQSTSDGTCQYTIPENCTDLWLVVMGCPTQWWHHQWDDNTDNDEQWPYRIQTTGTKPAGISRVYTADDFPADFVPRDTTVVINARLAYSSSNYSSVRVQYDMDAISEALGLTTAQLKAVKVGSANNPRFCGVSKTNSTLANNTTTSTSSATCFGHWFNTSGNVCNYDSNAAIFAEMYPESYGCYVGQYPGRLSPGKTYIIRQAVVRGSNRATMEVHLEVF